MSVLNKIKTWLSPNLPTKACPHRYCRQVHQVWVVGVLVALGPAFGVNPLYIVFLFVLGGAFYFVERHAWGGKTNTERYIDEAQQKDLNAKDVAHLHRVDDNRPSDQFSQRTVFPGGLVLRKGWARIAIGLDVFWTFLVLSSLWSIYSQDFSESYKLPEASLKELWSFVIPSFMIWFTHYAHRKATDTRKPRKQWFDLFSPAGSKA